MRDRDFEEYAQPVCRPTIYKEVVQDTETDSEFMAVISNMINDGWILSDCRAKIWIFEKTDHFRVSSFQE